MDINITPKKIALVLILFIPFAIFILDDSAGLGNIILTINNYQSDMNGEIQLNIDYTLTLEDQGFPSVPPIELDETGSAKIAVSKLFYWSDEQSKYVPYGNGDIYLITNEGEYTISLTNDDFYEYGKSHSGKFTKPYTN